MVVLSLLAVAGTIALSAPGANAPGSSAQGAGGIGSLVSASADVQGGVVGTVMVPKKCKASDPGVPVFHGPKGRNQVALTFDDGPDPQTNAFLDVLAEKKVDATFYVIGRYIPGREAILQREVAEGHSVGNHTLNHADVHEGGALAREEIDPTTRMITQATGIRPCTFRPPYGAYDTPLENFVKRADMDLIRWDIDTGDSQGAAPDTILQSVKDNLHDGAIILMHDGIDNSQSTLSVLPQIIDYIRSQGYEMVTIPEMLGLQTDEPRAEPVPVTPPPGLETPEVDDEQAAGDSTAPSSAAPERPVPAPPSPERPVP